MNSDERSCDSGARDWASSEPLQSPYSSKTCALFFGDEGPFYVHRKLLNVSPKLVPKNGRLDFDNIPIDVGHIIVHFLLTEKYQYLGLRRQTNDEVLDEFNTTILACSAAKNLELPTLSILAKEHLEVIGNQLKLTSIIRAIEASRPSPINVPEVAAYLKLRIERLVKSSSNDTSRILSDELAEPTSASEVLLICILELQAAPGMVEVETAQAEDMVINDICDTEAGECEEPPAQTSITVDFAAAGTNTAAAEEPRAERPGVEAAMLIEAAMPIEEAVPIEAPIPIEGPTPSQFPVPIESPAPYEPVPIDERSPAESPLPVDEEYMRRFYPQSSHIPDASPLNHHPRPSIRNKRKAKKPRVVKMPEITPDSPPSDEPLIYY
ncbi:unnamed protein product [Clonostachys byssicola]|uniref:BTB domain-containing protein n=1 Tax=Clonostachys byssicola TaxID=160290 RepID=A0A9N9URV4_9HYPO|nr:unnamed protein product [Clonostachys byssicola]